MSEADEDGGPTAGWGGWWVTDGERVLPLDEFRCDPGEHLTLIAFGIPTVRQDQTRDDRLLIATIVNQAIAWLKGPPATAPQCCICGRTFLRPVGPNRPSAPCFAYLRKDRQNDGVVIAMLYCGEHVSGEYVDALPAVVEDRLGLRPVATTRA
jgi:hypothetical protein